MQLNHIGIAAGADIRPVRYLLAQRLDAQRRTVVPAHAARARHCGRSGAGSAQPSALRVIALYQGLVRPFQRLGKAYELRCG
jgi:hypothetical protein